MKKTRIVALLLVLVMMISAATVASADIKVQAKSEVAQGNLVDWSEYRVLENGESASFYLLSSPWCLFELDDGAYIRYDDIIYDCAGTVTGKSDADWITVKKVKSGFVLHFDYNDTMKSRTGKVTVKGSGYKATMKFTQVGKDKLVSVKRNKNKVTVKLSYGSGKSHSIWVEEYKMDKDGTYSYKYLVDGLTTKKTITFKVKTGFSYNIYVGPAFVSQWGGYNSSSTSSCYFTVDSVKGSETYTIYGNKTQRHTRK